jgi:ATP-binding cassette subfamily F protein 3
MALATLTNIEKHFGQRALFDDLNLTIYEGERIGLIGANGSGKSTLFKLLTGEVGCEGGQVAITKGTKVAYLEQDPVFDQNNTVIDEAELAFARLHDLSHQMRDLEHKMGEVEGDELEKVLKQYEDVQHEFDIEGGYAWRHRVESMLEGIGLPPAIWEQNVSTLSGGQRSRLALTKMLISAPDLLMLDEPTNHLDLSAIEWLENYLADYAGAVILISHDRFLLDRLVTRVCWLTQSQISSYPGNYTKFVAQREVQVITQQRAYEEQQADIAKQQEFIRRFGAGQRSKEAKGREKRLDRLLQSEQLIGAVQTQSKIHLSIGTDRRAGDQVLDVKELSKSYDGRTLWDDVRFHVVRGERIGIIGPNGSGKTTMLEVLQGKRDADAGDIRWGANLAIGYYDQSLDDFDPENSILDELAVGRFGIKDKELRDIAALMMFRGDDVDKKMGMLSGGERARVALAELLLDKPNVLLLDEPTNHLDIDSCEALENALRDFAGTILCVSHDRYFIDKVINRLLVLRPPKVVDFLGNYSGWQEKLKQESSRAAEKAEQARAQQKKASAPAAKPQQQQQQAKPVAAKSAAAPVKKDNPYARPFGRLSVKELEKQIAETEKAVAACQQNFGSADAFRDPGRAKRLQEEFEALGKKLEELEAEYYAREQ